MQLDIFEHSRDVMLRNAAIDALRVHDDARGAAAIAALAAECAADPLLPALIGLLDRLRLPLSAPLDRSAAAAILRATEDAAEAASRVFGTGADAWLSPLWSALAAAMADLPFDPNQEEVHTAAVLRRAGKWAESATRTEAIASWRRQPAPLSWKVLCECRIGGLGAALPLFAELSWMAPSRAVALAPRLENAELNALLRGFDEQFEGEGDADDFAWFPAWVLVAQPGWASAMRTAQPGADKPAERCARQVLNLLLLERQGRHADVIEGRRRLRALNPRLFDLYLRTR